MPGTIKASFSRFVRYLYYFEDAVLIGLLAAMIGFAVLQIVLRNFFGSGITWADTLLKILVLWVGLAGAMVATRRDHHISIDVLVRFLPDKFKGLIQRIVDLFTASVCAILTFYSARFVALEYESGTIAFAEVPSWACELILPIAFAVIALRYFLYLFLRGTSYMPDTKT